jgi:hypothetical protein
LRGCERPGSLLELNLGIAELREELNARPMRQYGESRLERFEKLERTALRPLPARRYVFADWTRAQVNIDYHVEIEGHYYSVPHALVHEQVEVRVSPLTVEAFYRNERVASHEKGLGRGSHTTDPRHMPRAHRETSRVEPLAPDRLGRTRGRSAYTRSRRGHPRGSTAPRAGVPVLPRTRAPDEALRRGACRCLRARTGGEGALVSARR